MGGQKIKKGTRGESAMFITRAQALRRLQVSLADFRRLCILKGVYPREPKKKLSGLDKTYYHLKDITHLKYDPILSKVRELKTYFRRYRKAMGRNDKTKARSIRENKPIITLQHIVKERYPCFVDALRDLDDALSTCSLFASLGADDSHQIHSSMIKKSTFLMDEFMYLVSELGFLTKSFISVKGFYFQAKILGETITWLIPHQFTQKIPDEVDFKVMSTFLEFYHTLLRFVNFKLYQLNNLTYPPSINTQISETGGRFLALNSYNLSKMNTGIPSNIEQKAEKRRIFEGLTFFISREVPFFPVAFVIKSLGGKVGWENEYSSIKKDDEGITHYIVDRPVQFLKSFMDNHENCEFIQPQWVFDSMNESIRLPTRAYGPGEKLPPHLSPFVDDSTQGYIPTQRQVLDEIKESCGPLGSREYLSGEESTQIGDLSEHDSDIEVQQAREDAYLESIEREQSLSSSNPGSCHADSLECFAEAEAKAKATTNRLQTAKKLAKKRREDEQREQQKTLLKKKHKRLLQRIEYSQKIASDKAERLESKRKLLNRESHSKPEA
ncbi:pescadillo containing BRCT domain [Cryptosporidium canis]|uniref:Pescadillo homolog n=1 Tax=Cryptosporidium canis TaxID=195482 RepID=A0ABQ8P3E4_9CRYT|nr:pescadillo containing BRCT domain [Cryptosporidium canis]